MTTKSKWILLLSIIVCSCDTFDSKLIIHNASDQTLYYTYSPYERLDSFYKKTAREQGAFTYLNCIDEIPSKTKKERRRMGRGNVWERYINGVCEDKKLRIYTFNIDTLKKYSFKNVADNNRYIQKKEVSVDDLNKTNWIVTFP